MFSARSKVLSHRRESRHSFTAQVLRVQHWYKFSIGEVTSTVQNLRRIASYLESTNPEGTAKTEALWVSCEN